MKSLNLKTNTVIYQREKIKQSFIIFILNKLVFVDFACLISQKKDFQFNVIQNSSYDFDIFGPQEDSYMCPAFWKYMDKILLVTN